MFVVSKIWSALAEPTMVTVLVLIAGTVLLYTRRWRMGRGLLAGLAAVLVAVSVLPVDTVLIGPLEDRFPPPATLPERVDGIIALGGAFNPVLTDARNQPSANGALERITAMIGLARRYPEARIVFIGGSGWVTAPDLKEARVAKDFLDGIGFDTSRMEFEDQSRNTRENALFGRDLVRPRLGETWLLVTSAMHMPRAVGSFRVAGWPVIAYPVDYLTTGKPGRPGFDPQDGLDALADGLHEWQGLAYYRLRGWTESLLPAPL